MCSVNARSEASTDATCECEGKIVREDWGKVKSVDGWVLVLAVRAQSECARPTRGHRESGGLVSAGWVG